MDGKKGFYSFGETADINPHGEHCGAKARQWRRRVGRLAAKAADKSEDSKKNKQDKSGDTRTYKFPLDGAAGVFTPEHFEEAKELYKAVQGVGKGSLAGLLCAVHLSGFRVFHNNSEPKKHNPQAIVAGSIAFDGGAFCKITDDNVAMHQVIAAVLRKIRREKSGDKNKSPTKSELTSRIFSSAASAPHGLSWLFGGGLTNVFANGKNIDEEKIDKELADGFGVPADDAHRLARIRQIREYAGALSLPVPFYRKKNYSDFRVAVAGTLDSWMQNYYKRLKELEGKLGGDNPFVSLKDNISSLKESVEKFPSKESGGDNLLFDGSPFRLSFRFEDIERLAGDLPKSFNAISGELGVLLGKSDRLPDKDTVDEFDKFNEKIDEMHGFLAQMKNICEQEKEELNTSEKRKSRQSGKDDSAAGYTAIHARVKKCLDPMEKMEKINRISGGAADVEKISREAGHNFNILRGHLRECFDGAMKAARQCKVLEAIRTVKNKPKDMGEEEAAARIFLHRLGKMLRGLSDNNKKRLGEKLLLPLFNCKEAWENNNGKNGKNWDSQTEQQWLGKKGGRKNYREFLLEKKGEIFRSAYSKSRHKAYAVGWRKLDAEKLLDALQEAAQAMERSDKRDDLRDWLEISFFVMNQNMSRLSEKVKKEFVGELADKPKELTDDFNFRIPPSWGRAFQSDEVARDYVIKAFNNIRSAMRGLLFQILRESFVARVSFSPVGQDSLLYAAKEQPWTPPARYESAFEDCLSPAEKNAAGGILPVKTLEKLILARGGKGNKLGELTEKDLTFLSQLPHDWLMPLDNWAHTKKERAAIEIKKTARGTTKPKPLSGVRLVGVSSMRGHLLNWLRQKNEAGMQEYRLILEQKYRQTFSWNGDDIKITAEEDKLRADCAIPFMLSLTAEKIENGKIFNRIVAVDLGERGIGFAVFDIAEFLRTKNASPLFSGALPIPSIRKLTKSVDKHRRKMQPNQKVQDSYSKDLERRRQNVIGDVCHRIDFLCAKYGGFPVLEDGIQNLESGGQQLKNVYGSVLHRYTFSKVDAHQKQRGDYWFSSSFETGKGILHPYLVSEKKPKGLNIFPGVTVSAANTSRFCAMCGKNPMGDESLGAEKKGEKFEFKDGKTLLQNGEICLREKYLPGNEDKKEKLHKYHARKKRRVPFGEHSLCEGPIERDKLKALIKFNMRRPPADLRSKDTTQSVYHCVYTNCKLHRQNAHADINAAVNIGRKFLREKIDREKSLANYDRIKVTSQATDGADLSKPNPNLTL